jgi:hypothetical protein
VQSLGNRGRDGDRRSGGKESPSALAVQTIEYELVEPIEAKAAICLSRAEQKRDAVRLRPAGGEEQCVGRGLVEPMDVVDNDEQGSAFGGERKQAERRGADREAVAARFVRAKGERGPQRVRLRLRQLLKTVNQRPAELEETGEREFRLRLDAVGAQHAHSIGAFDGIGKQCALADPGFPPDNERPAAPASRVLSSPSIRAHSSPRPSSTNARYRRARSQTTRPSQC